MAPSAAQATGGESEVQKLQAKLGKQRAELAKVKEVNSAFKLNVPMLMELVTAAQAEKASAERDLEKAKQDCKETTEALLEARR